MDAGVGENVLWCWGVLRARTVLAGRPGLGVAKRGAGRGADGCVQRSWAGAPMSAPANGPAANESQPSPRLDCATRRLRRGARSTASCRADEERSDVIRRFAVSLRNSVARHYRVLHTAECAALFRLTVSRPSSCFKFAALNTRLPDDRLQCADANFRVAGHRNGNGGIGQLLLHHDMTATLPYFDETMLSQNCTNLFAGQDTQLSQPPPRGG